MKKRAIKSISFLISNKRYRVHSSRYGKFKIPIVENVNGRSRSSSKLLTAREVISHQYVQGGDPFLTLENGEKIRVFQGGDSSAMVVEAAALLDLHDKEASRKNKQRHTRKKTGDTSFFENLDIFEDLNGW